MGLDLEDCWLNIQNGNERALEQLFKATNSNLCIYIFNITKDRFIAQEISQDLFLKLWQNRSKIIIKGSLLSYLYQAAHNQAINFLIQKDTLKLSVNRFLPGDPWLVLHEKADTNAFLIEKLEAEDTENLINRIILELPEQCRRIFMKSRFEGKSIDEIALEQDITPNTVRTQIYRALDKIKAAIEKSN